MSQIATVVSYMVIVRNMAEHDFGVLSLLYAFIPVVSTVASLGLEQTLRRYQPEYLQAGNRAAASWLVRFVASARFVTNLVVIGIVLALWNLVAPLFHLGPYRVEFAMFGVLILLQFQSRILQLSLASHMLHRYSAGSLAVLPLVKLVVYLALAWAGAFSLQAAIVADTLAYATAYVFLSRAHRAHCAAPGGAPAYAPDGGERKRLFRYGLFNNFNDAGAMILDVRSDNFFIAALINPLAAGAYTFYNRLNEMVANVSPARLFDSVVQPLFFSIEGSEAQRKVPRYFTFLLNVNLLLMLSVLTYATVYHADVVAVLFAGKFAQYSSLLPLVIAFATLNVIAVPVTLAAQHAEKAGIILLGKITVVYQVAATLLLIPKAGLYGAAFATGTAQLMKNLFVWWHVRDRARWLNWGAVASCAVIVWVPAGLLCWACRHWIAVPAGAHLLLGAFICALAALIYVRTPALGSSDREIMASVLHGKEAKLIRLLGLFPRERGG